MELERGRPSQAKKPFTTDAKDHPGIVTGVSDLVG